MPLYHPKLHNINSDLDHFKQDGLFGLGTGLGMITAAGDQSITFDAEPALVTDPVMTIFDRTSGENPVLIADGTGAVSFSRDEPTYPGTRDIQGRFDATILPAGDNVWWMDVDGNAFFDGDVTINGSLIGPDIQDTLDEILNPATGTPTPSNEAYERTMILWDDASPGSVNAFRVDYTGKYVSVGDSVRNYDLNVFGEVAVDIGASAGDAIVITHTAAGAVDIKNASDDWSILQSGYASFKGIDSTPVAGVVGLSVTSGTGASGITVLQGDNAQAAINLSNVDDGIDIRGNDGNWLARAEGTLMAVPLPGATSPGLYIGTNALGDQAAIGIVHNADAPAIPIINSSDQDVVQITNSGTGNSGINFLANTGTNDLLGTGGVWYVRPDGRIHTDEIAEVDTRTETPEVRSVLAGGLLLNASVASDITARTLDGSFVFDVNDSGTREVIPVATDVINLGSVTNRWLTMWVGSIYVEELLDVKLIQGNGTDPLRIDSNTQDLELETQGGDIHIITAGTTVLGNSLILDEIERIRNVAGSPLTVEFVDAQNIVLDMVAGNGIVPTNDDELLLGADNQRF